MIDWVLLSLKWFICFRHFNCCSGSNFLFIFFDNLLLYLFCAGKSSMIVETSARFLWLPHASRKKREVIKDRLDVLKCTVSSIFFFYIGALTRDPLRDLWVVGGGDRCKGGGRGRGRGVQVSTFTWRGSRPPRLERNIFSWNVQIKI